MALSCGGSTGKPSPCRLPLPILLPSIRRASTNLHPPPFWPCSRLSGHEPVPVPPHPSVCPLLSVLSPAVFIIHFFPRSIYLSISAPSACPGAGTGLSGVFRGHRFPVPALSQAFSRVSSLSPAASSAARQKQHITLLWSSPKDSVMDCRAHLPPGDRLSPDLARGGWKAFGC